MSLASPHNNLYIDPLVIAQNNICVLHTIHDVLVPT